MIKLPKISAPPAEAGKAILYVGLDGALHAINENGQEIPLGGAGGGLILRTVANDTICTSEDRTHPDLSLNVTAGEQVVIEGVLWCNKQNGQISLNLSVPGNSISHVLAAAWSGTGGSVYVMDGIAWPQNMGGITWMAGALPGCAYDVALEVQITVTAAASGAIALGVSDDYSSGGVTLRKGSHLRFTKA